MKQPTTSHRKVNSRQKDYLVDFMQQNYNLLYGKFKNDHGDETKNRVWSRLTEEINKLGPPHKDNAKWKKVSIIFLLSLLPAELAFIFACLLTINLLGF